MMELVDDLHIPHESSSAWKSTAAAAANIVGENEQQGGQSNHMMRKSSTSSNGGGGGGGDHERTSSMENEPRTLSYNQIHLAREAALYVFKTTSLQDAISIFTRGMERVDSRGQWSSDSGGEVDCHKRRSETDQEEELDDDYGDDRRWNNTFRVSSSIKRDIATAPF